MLIKRLSQIGLLIITTNLFSQSSNLLKASTIPPELLRNANAVIRHDKTITKIKSYNDVTIEVQRIVTVFNENGINKAGAVCGYDDHRFIKQMEAKIYNANGEEIKKFKKSDFEDESAVEGATLYSDSRVKYLRYTPVSYPYTIEFNLEVQFKSTAFLPVWTPIDGYYTSTELSEYKIINDSDIEIKLKPSNFNNYPIDKKDEFHYVATAIPAINPEAYSPSFKDFTPALRVAMTSFNMEGVKGVNNSWEEFGKWYESELLSGTDILPESVKMDIINRTSGIDDPIEKAKIVYKFVQEKTRYISVQVGIGGWKPFNAQEVDRLGYSDCKGLSNYTKALMDAVGIESHFVLLYGGREIKNIQEDFSMADGNHAILCIPNDDQPIWLECTSQTNPFGFIAGFTDDRDVLVITPDGGKILHTKTYSTEENLQHTKAEMKISSSGAIDAKVEVSTFGYQYALHRNKQFLPKKEQELNLKAYWNNINDLKFDHFELVDDKDEIKFLEKVALSAEGYATKTGNLLLFQPNAFNKFESIPTRYTERLQDFEVDRGFTDTDEFVINYSPELSLEAVSKDVNIENKFGSYKTQILDTNDQQITYKRTFILNKGYYPKEEYEDFRTFLATVVKNDQSKIALKLN